MEGRSVSRRDPVSGRYVVRSGVCSWGLGAVHRNHQEKAGIAGKAQIPSLSFRTAERFSGFWEIERVVHPARKQTATFRRKKTRQLGMPAVFKQALTPLESARSKICLIQLSGRLGRLTAVQFCIAAEPGKYMAHFL